ncbi:DUF2855 family protein [Hydrogenophaga sp.]|uniref:DUF2855 family protein n=1 Tax=Hydrogenophaga sp. TaxID=1904254 RepID=UPI0025B9DF96|nr:DUF2855 family protein [Hydrogenophaga sp.]
MTTQTLQVQKRALANTRWQTTEDTPLIPGQIRLRVDLFSLTANNITYAAMGEAMEYWRFFPTTDADWGVIPVWGFATITESAHTDLAAGDKLYGYWPMATATVLQADMVTSVSLVDAAPHRDGLHPVYNQYTRCARDPFYTPDSEAVQALLRPLFMTSWLIDDFLADNDFFGTQTLLLSSASSKTAYGTAFQLAQREGLQVIGLTSEGNRAFCESLGCYTRVLSYEQLGEMPADVPCVYVDFAGSASLREQIHRRFTALRYSCAIGATHVSDLGGGKGLPGPAPTLFFAPAQIKKRRADWGAAELGQRLLASWQTFTTQVGDPTRPWLRVVSHLGADALQNAYLQMLVGRSDPQEGHVFRLD